MKSYPPYPSEKEVKHYNTLALNLEEYVMNDRTLKRLFNRIFPKNVDLSEIKIKVSTLNDFYSTNIYKTHLVSKHILNIDIDERLSQKDESVVNDIAKVDMNGKPRYFYSFATKYCSHHHPNDFPIYDRHVDNMLWHFQKQYQFSSFKRPELKNYSKFKSIIRDFINHFKLSDFTIKEIDRYLWACGSRYFKRL